MKTEKIFSAIILVGILMKLFHLPFAAPLLTLSLGTLSILYFPLGFYFLNVKFKKKNIGLSLISGLLLNIIPIGILFKLMHWPSSDQMLIVGIVSSVLLFVIISVVKNIKSSTNEEVKKTGELYQKNLLDEEVVVEESNDLFYKNMYLRISILFSLAVLFLMFL
jgi:hypothetical protein